jgi:hypothetical protein
MMHIVSTQKRLDSWWPALINSGNKFSINNRKKGERTIKDLTRISISASKKNSGSVFLLFISKA